MTLQDKLFKRTKENFLCEHCGAHIEGTGFTNHCTQCLWSKHVDINPGDRRASCKELMEPVSVEIKNGVYVIVHQCVRCGFERKNKVQKDDSFNTLLEISKKRS